MGCHSDAHEQAKWLGDDIALKSAKYDYGLRSIRGAIATLRRLGFGHPLTPTSITVRTWDSVIEAEPSPAG
jgi:hypothetical protein